MQVLCSKSITIIASFLFFNLNAFPQQDELKLPVTIVQNFGPFYPFFIPIDMKGSKRDEGFQYTYPNVKGIPPDWKNIQQAVIKFDPKQFLYQNYFNGKINKNDFNDLHTLVNDDSQFTKTTIKCFVNIVTGTDQYGKKLVIIDENNNNDFSDDKPFQPITIDTTEMAMNENIDKVKYQRFTGNNIINDFAPIIIASKNKGLFYSIPEYAVSPIEKDGHDYKILTRTAYFFSRSYRRVQMICIPDSDKLKINEDSIIQPGGFLKIDNKYYKFHELNLDKPELILTAMKSTGNAIAPQIGFKAPAFAGKEILSNETIGLNQFKGKYVFLDFWGTWCVPCLEQMPLIKNAFNKLSKDSIVFISIASDDNLDVLKKFLIKEKITWYQLLSREITDNYKIEYFPTSFLIDPYGKIVAKNIEATALIEQIRRIMKQ